MHFEKQLFLLDKLLNSLKLSFQLQAEHKAAFASDISTQIKWINTGLNESVLTKSMNIA